MSMYEPREFVRLTRDSVGQLVLFNTESVGYISDCCAAHVKFVELTVDNIQIAACSECLRTVTSALLRSWDVADTAAWNRYVYDEHNVSAFCPTCGAAAYDCPVERRVRPWLRYWADAECTIRDYDEND